jgi:flagellar assembly factor FliW
LKGTILGFEEYREYVLRNIFEDASPFRVLACLEEHIAFLVVNPFVVTEDYNLEIDDAAASNLGLTGENMQHVAVLCVARKENDHYKVNLRSPLIINTVEERFQQVILQNEAYGMEAIFSVDNYWGSAPPPAAEPRPASRVPEPPPSASLRSEND